MKKIFLTEPAFLRIVVISILFAACEKKPPASTPPVVSTAGNISTYAGNGIPGFSSDGIQATASELSSPAGLAQDGAGNIYIADLFNYRIRKVSSTGIITTVAGNGSAGFSGDGAAATNAQLNTAYGVAVDASGNIYIADQNNNRVRMVNSLGVISTIAGTGFGGASGDGGPATAATLSAPDAVAVDASGNIYICDHSSNRIRKISAGIISTVAGGGTANPGDGGPATAASLNFPTGVAADNFGNIYIADGANNRIRKVNAGGIISTIAGNGTVGFSGDGGPATAAMINDPISVTLDASGNIYIVDAQNNRVREINTNSIITTIAGNGTVGFSGDGGAAVNAALNAPYGITVVGSGFVYISDEGNNRVRQVNQ
jgi:sugar lactone lactonase YvrE